MVGGKGYIYLETIENIIVDTRNEGDYIRCKNMIEFLDKVDKGNDVVKEYGYKISRVDMEKEYRKWAGKHGNSINIVFIVIEIFLIGVSYFCTEYLYNRFQLSVYMLIISGICIYFILRNVFWSFYYKIASLFI